MIQSHICSSIHSLFHGNVQFLIAVLYSRKLTMFDNWSNFSVHVAMDNTVVIEDISMYINSSVISHQQNAFVGKTFLSRGRGNICQRQDPFLIKVYRIANDHI